MKFFLICSVFISFFYCFNSLSLNYKQFIFRFKPLIGGPQFLPIHVMIYNRDVDIEMDFIPINATCPQNNINLILGKDIRGKVRHLNRANNMLNVDEVKFIDYIISDYQVDNLNLYSNNCYHFAYHFVKKSIEWDAK